VTCYEISRLVQVADNPNHELPRLSLGSKHLKKPIFEDMRIVQRGAVLKVDADVARINSQVSAESLHTDNIADEPEAQSIEGRALNFEAAPDVQISNGFVQGGIIACRERKARVPDPPTKPVRSALHPGAPSWTTPAERKAALNRWCAVIAKEVAKPYETKIERDAAEAFVRGHRFSIACAFERKLVRAMLSPNSRGFISLKSRIKPRPHRRPCPDPKSRTMNLHQKSHGLPLRNTLAMVGLCHTP
jgi:hypothetical protein